MTTPDIYKDQHKTDPPHEKYVVLPTQGSTWRLESWPKCSIFKLLVVVRPMKSISCPPKKIKRGVRPAGLWGILSVTSIGEFTSFYTHGRDRRTPEEPPGRRTDLVASR